jgi:hypothetical protein
MSTMRMEELEARLLLSGFNLSACSSLSQPMLPSAGHSSLAGPDGSQVHWARPGEVGGGIMPGQSAGQNSAFAGNREGGNLVVWVVVGSPRSEGSGASPAPNAVETNVGAGPLASPGSRNGVNATPAERTPTTFVSAGANPPLLSGAEIQEAVPNVTAQIPASSPGPSSVKVAAVDAGVIYNTNGFQPHPLPSSLGYSTFSELAVQSGTLSQGWLSLLPPAPGMAAPLPLSELPSLALGGHAALLPSLELGPPGQREIPLTLPDLSAPEAGLLQFLAELGQRGRQAVLLCPPDLSALEAGLLQFLAELGQTSSQLAEDREGAALWMWVLAAAGAGMACEIAYRQYRRTAGRGGTDAPPLLGWSLDDAL